MSSPPSMPEVEPSRGDEESSSNNNNNNNNNNKRHSKRRSSKKSESTTSSRRSSHRRSSTSKSEKSPTRGGGGDHSPRRSGGTSSKKRRSSATTSSSAKKTPETSNSHKLRLASGAASEIRSPPLLSPSNPAISSPSDQGDHSGRSSKRSSRTSGGDGARYSKTPNSKRGKKRGKKLRVAQPGAVAAPPELDDTISVTTGSTAGVSLMTSSSSGGSSTSPAAGTNVDQIPIIRQDPTTTDTTRVMQNTNSANQDQWVPLEATVAPNVDEIEAARLQGREEGRNEREDKPPTEIVGDGPQRPGDNIVFVASKAPKEDKSARKYAFAAFVIVVVAAAIVVWQVMQSKDDPAARLMGPTPFTPPTQDDCLAVSEQLEVVGQNETSVRTFAVEVNIAVKSGQNLAVLKAELEVRTERYVLPLLIGCQLEGPIVIENNNYVIANALLEQVTMSEPKACDIATPTSPKCSLAYMELDLFLKDPNVSSEYILELLAYVFQHKGLLEVLKLSISEVETIDTQTQYEVLDTSSPAPSTLLPSSSPSTKPVQIIPDDLPTEEECQEIASGIGNGAGGEGVLQEYDIYMDVMLDILKEDLTEITIELEQKLQRFLMPALAGCDPSFVLDGMVVVDNNSNPTNGDSSTNLGDNTNPEGSGPTGGSTNPDSSTNPDDPDGSGPTGGSTNPDSSTNPDGSTNPDESPLFDGSVVDNTDPDSTVPDTPNRDDGRPAFDGSAVDNNSNPKDSKPPRGNDDSALNDSITLGGNNRRLVTEGLLLGAKNEAEYLAQGSCLTESEPPCYRYVIHLDVFVKSIVASADFTDPLMAKFKEEPLVERLELLSPFVNITIVDTIAQTPSAMPSFAPSASPTTPAPSPKPSMVPSTSPSRTPSSEPTPRPTGRPTPNPTPWPTRRPTWNPTPWPTRRPTRNPTPWPTRRPTRRPTRNPTPWPTPPPPPTPPPTPAPTESADWMPLPTPAPTESADWMPPV